MSTYVWCEDSSSGFQFWRALFGALYPDIIIETKQSNSKLRKANVKLAARLLYDITRNTGFETDKSKIGYCFINSCCQWAERGDDDICGLDDSRLTYSQKMYQIRIHSDLSEAFKEAGL